MNWIERLNRSLSPAPPDQPEVLGWYYSGALGDNVPHRHTYFEICLIGQWGEGIFTVAGREHRIQSGDLFFARPGVIHQIQNTQSPGMELFWVSFAAPQHATGGVGELWEAFGTAEKAVWHDDGRVVSLWNALRYVAAAPEVAGKDAQIEALSAALLLAIAQCGAGDEAPLAEPPSHDPRAALARLAVRYIHDNLGRRLHVEEIAAHVHLSSRHLGRLFHDFAGTSPAAYLETARMDRARHLLTQSSLPIKEIAIAVGFEDVHHFTRVFARHHGVAPGQYRKKPESHIRGIRKIGDLV